MFYTDFLKEVRNTFSLGTNQRPIFHYEHETGFYRPLGGPDDLDHLINFQFHLKSSILTIIKLNLKLDQKLPPTDAPIGGSSSSSARKNGTVRKSRNSGIFILEDVDDPILAPKVTRKENDNGDPLMVYNTSYFVEELNIYDKVNPVKSKEEDKWSLKGLLGQGGFGKVYVAE